MSSAIRTKPAGALIVFAMGALLAPAVRAQAAPNAVPDWRFADPAATMIGGFDVQAVLQSPLVKSVLERVAAQSGGSIPAMEPALKTLGGISQIYFSLSARRETADAIVLVKGSLSDVSAKAFLEGAKRRGTTVPSEASKMDLRRVDADTVLYGDTALLDAAVRRLRLPASAKPSPLVARAKSLSEGNDFWIGGSLPNIPAAAMLSASIRGLAVGLSLQRDFRFQVSLDMTTPDMAAALAAEAKNSIEEVQQQNNFDAQREIEVVGSTLRIKMTVGGDKFLALVEDKLGQVAPMFGSRSPSVANGTPPRQPQPIQPPKPQAIKIYGLDDGPKEIPLAHP